MTAAQPESGARRLPGEDLDGVRAALERDWAGLNGARLLVTGGTGFIGRWLLETLDDAITRSGLRCEAVVLSRNPAAFARAAPHLAAQGAFRFVRADVTAALPVDGVFSHIIHAATDASADLNARAPLRMFDVVVDGTRRVLDVASRQAGSRLLFLSSGAVYGAQAWTVPHVDETWTGGPDCRDPRAAYAEGKRAAEMLCAIHARQFGVEVVTARIFAVLGPLLSLDTHFAAGNFIRDAMAGRTVRVDGAGTAVRSYIYIADLIAWLWTMLARAGAGAVYNVGSPEGVSIAGLAETVARVLGAPGFEVLGKTDAGWNPGRYVPSTALIERELGVRRAVGLDEAIRRTAAWNGWRA